MRTRIRIDDTGRLEVVDPGFGSLELLRAIDPGFHIRSSELPGFEFPRFMRTRNASCGLEKQQLPRMTERELWQIHGDAMEKLYMGSMAPMADGKASILELKVELSHRILSHCRLCARRCGVDRIHGELGFCGLGTEATVASHFVHIAEEPAINPSLLISLAGCGLRCRFCQQWELLSPAAVDGKALDATLWEELDTEGARSVSFIGGDPDESLYALLRFLKYAPPDWKLPVVWNCHAYSTCETLGLLDGVVDAYVPDLKYGDEKCGRELSDVSGYPEAARTAIRTMASQDVPVVVRILVLPGHFHCCHAPALDFLSSLDGEMLSVSVRGQYCPEWRIAPQDGEMARRPYPEEVEQVREKAISLGFNLI